MCKIWSYSELNINKCHFLIAARLFVFYSEKDMVAVSGI